MQGWHGAWYGMAHGMACDSLAFIGCMLPRWKVKLETFLCDQMDACVDALHKLLWKFSEVRPCIVLLGMQLLWNLM